MLLKYSGLRKYDQRANGIFFRLKKQNKKQKTNDIKSNRKNVLSHDTGTFSANQANTNRHQTNYNNTALCIYFKVNDIQPYRTTRY